MKNKNFGRKRQAIYILSNRKSTRIIKTLMDFFFFIKVKIKMVCFSVPSPGLTGVWQVSGRSTITDFEEIVQMDVDYIDHWSIWRDIGILFKTVWLVICGDDGAQ